MLSLAAASLSFSGPALRAPVAMPAVSMQSGWFPGASVPEGKSAALPFVPKPAHLDGSYVGDVVRTSPARASSREGSADLLWSPSDAPRRSLPCCSPRWLPLPPPLTPLPRFCRRASTRSTLAARTT